MEPALSNADGLDAELVGVRAHVRQRDLGRLLHDVTELAGQGQAALAVASRRGLDEQHVAADARSPPGRWRHPACRSDRPLRTGSAPPRYVRTSPRRSGAPGGVARRPRIFVADLAQQLADLALEVPDAGLARVVPDDRPQRVVGERDLTVAQTVALELAPHQVVAGDGDLLVVGVAVERTISMRSSNGPGDGVRPRWPSG